MIQTKHKKSFFELLIIMAVFVTTISQLPIFDKMEATRLIAIPSWIIIVLFILPKFRLNNRMFLLIIPLLSLGIYISLINAATNKDYTGIQIIYPFYLSMFLFIIGVTASQRINDKIILHIGITYFIASAFISVSIYFDYFARGIDVFSPIYEYDSKNSVSQIILTGLIFSIFIVHSYNSSLWKIINFPTAFFMLAVILFLRSRATIIALPLLVIVPVLLSKSQLKIKFGLIIITVIAYMIIISNPGIYDSLVYGILSGGRDWGDLDSLSSGRYQEYLNFRKDILGNELFGIGKSKIESMPLSVILQFGVPIGLIFIVYAFWPLYWGARHLDKSQPISIVVIVISMSYFLNGMFEQLAPFGPGVKNFILWLLFGIMYGKRTSLNKQTIKTRTE